MSKYSIDAVVRVIMSEFPDAWWAVDGDGHAKLSCDFDYWNEELQEEWSDRDRFEAHVKGDPAEALAQVLEKARAEKQESISSLALRPSKERDGEDA